MRKNCSEQQRSVYPRPIESGEKQGSRHRKKTALLAVLLAAAIAAAGAGSLQAFAQNGSGSSGTKVIRTSSEDDFASETAKLAKMYPGSGIQNAESVSPFSSARLIVRVKDGNHADLSKYGAKTLIESQFGVSILQFSSAEDARRAAAKIGSSKTVSYVEPDDCSLNTGDMTVSAVLSGESPDTVNIPRQDVSGISAGKPEKIRESEEDGIFESSVQTQARTAAAGSDAMSWGAAYIQADKYAAFVKTNGAKTIKVAVVDSGVSAHSRLDGRILKGRDFVDNDYKPDDQNGHGTHVAGIIADCTPGLQVKILPVRVMNASGSGSPSAVGNGIRYAVKSGAKVINLSLGGYSHFKYVEECVQYAHKKGVTVVVAAGNQNDNTRYLCPAHMSSPIVVGAIGQNGKRAYFSNYGKSLDVVAPGVNITSCWLNGNYATASGTSMAAPHISAAAAMYRIMKPSASASRIETMVRSYAKDLGSKGTDKYYGRGVPRMAGAITPARVSLNSDKAVVSLANSLTLKATVDPPYAGKRNLKWTSSDLDVVTVSGGKLTPRNKGTALITVRTVNGKEATCRVTVTTDHYFSAAGTIADFNREKPSPGMLFHNVLIKGSGTGVLTASGIEVCNAEGKNPQQMHRD